MRTTANRRAPRRHRRVRLLATWTFSVAVLSSGPAAADNVSAYQQDGPCSQVALAIPVEAARLDPYVPDEFLLKDIAGYTTLGVFAGVCDMSIDGGARQPGVVAGVFANDTVDPEGNAAGFDLSWVTSSLASYDAYRSLGFGELSTGAAYNEEAVGPTTLIEADVPDGYVPFSISMVAANGGAEEVEFPLLSVHWDAGTRGFVRGTYDHVVHRAGGGVAELTAAPGTPLAYILNAETVTAAGFFLQFDHTGTVELVNG